MPDDLPSPWIEFLTELDQMLEAPLELHCIGGFILVYFYGLPRSTGDIDYYSAVPANVNLPEMAGEGSKLQQLEADLARARSRDPLVLSQGEVHPRYTEGDDPATHPVSTRNNGARGGSRTSTRIENKQVVYFQW
jgi:hypothetical protein